MIFVVLMSGFGTLHLPKNHTTRAQAEVLGWCPVVDRVSAAVHSMFDSAIEYKRFSLKKTSNPPRCPPHEDTVRRTSDDEWGAALNAQDRT